MPISLHSHSGQFCQHGQGSLESMVQTAIQANFITYGLSEHIPRDRINDFYPEESHLTPEDLSDQFDRFVKEAIRLRTVYGSSIDLLIGLETELIEPNNSFDLLNRTLARHKDSIDYLVGSVHHVNQIPIDFDQSTFDRALCSLTEGLSEDDPDQSGLFTLCSAYFDAQFDLINRYRPEVIGHFDLCLLYHPNLDLRSNQEVWAKIRANIQLAVSYGALFEVNSASLSKGWSTPYPSQPILSLIISLGGRLTLSDDAHRPDRVGSKYAQTLDYLRQNKVETIWYLQRYDPLTTHPSLLPMSPRGTVVATSLPGLWSSHSFWTSLKELPS